MLQLIVGLVGYSLLTIFGSPVMLSRGGWRLRAPRLCLLAWYGLFVSGLVATVVAVTLAVGLGIGAHESIPADGSWVGPTRDIVIAWVALAVAGGLFSVIATKAAAMIISERQFRAEFAELVAAATYRRELIGGLRVSFIASPAPIACSLGGRTPEIVVSSCIDQDLAPAEVRAVIEHERAHVRGHHGLITRLAALNCACVPVLLGPRELRRATDLMIELIADDAAARTCGAGQLAGALQKLGSTQGNATMQLRAERLLALATI